MLSFRLPLSRTFIRFFLPAARLSGQRVAIALWKLWQLQYRPEGKLIACTLMHKQVTQPVHPKKDLLGFRLHFPLIPPVS